MTVNIALTKIYVSSNSNHGDNMMLSPKDYRKELEASNFKKILRERDRIVEFMQDFENDRLPAKYYERDPSPEEVYLINLDYLKEICDLIKIKKGEDHSDNKSVRLSPVLAIEEVLSKFDGEKQKQFFEDLKVKDEELYHRYIDWKINREKY